MSFTKEVQGEKTVLKIGGSLSIYEASILRKEWGECLESCESLVIDLSDVTDCDIAGIQLLYSARMTAEEAEKAFEITAVSPAISKTLTAAGLPPEI